MRVRASRSARWIAACVLTALAAVPTGSSAAPAPQPPPRPGSSAGFFTYNGSASLEGTRPIGLFPAGMNVWVLDGTPHVARIALAVGYAVSQLQRYGLAVTFKGIAADEDAAKGTGYRGVYGSITVDEAAFQNGPRCAKVAGAPAATIAEGVTYPGHETVGPVEQLDLASVTLCPDVFTHAATIFTSTVLHEMGHAVGLGHYRGTYLGAGQVMNPFISAHTRYQQGDVDGLRYIAAQTRRIDVESRLQGAVERWDVNNGTLRVRGWAVTGRARETTAVRVTMDGRLRAGVLTTIERRGIAARFAGTWPKPGYQLDVAPLRAGRHDYCVLALSVLVPDRQRTLGCREISYTPPPRPSVIAPARSSVASLGSPERSAPNSSLLPAAGVLVLLVLIAGGFIGYARRRP